MESVAKTDPRERRCRLKRTKFSANLRLA